jgi:hypothetical protein
MNRHKTTNMTKLFVGVGTFSGKRAVGSMGDVLTVARNVLNRDVIDIRIMRTLGKIAATLGVIGAIAASSTVPAAAWYGYHHRHHCYHHGYYHHRYYAYYARYDRERYYHYAGGGY